MKKRVYTLIILLVLLSVPAFSDGLELGFGFMPAGSENADGGVMENSYKTLHLGYRWWNVMYFSLDSIIVPPYKTQYLTAQEADGAIYLGYYRPSMINLYDLGLKVKLGPFMASAQAGLNSLYIHKQRELIEMGEEINSNLGANLKLAAGVRILPILGVEFAMVSVQPSLKMVGAVLGGSISDDPEIREAAGRQFRETLMNSIMFVLYLD